jgi:hypothetical protein
LEDLKIMRNLFDLLATIDVGLEQIVVHLSAPPPFGCSNACYAETINRINAERITE